MFLCSQGFHHVGRDHARASPQQAILFPLERRPLLHPQPATNPHAPAHICSTQLPTLYHTLLLLSEHKITNCSLFVSNNSFVYTTPDLYVTFMVVIYLTCLLSKEKHHFLLKLGIQCAIYFCINVTNTFFNVQVNFIAFLFTQSLLLYTNCSSRVEVVCQ